jgi:hypothetical protein
MIRSLPFFVFALMLLFLLGMAAVAIYAGLRARRSASIVRTMPTSPIGMAEDGYREFEGVIEAVPALPITAPLTKQPCVWYEMKVEKYASSRGEDHSGGHWAVVKAETSTAPFLVRDATGVCIVDPHRADITPTDKSQWFGKSESPKDRNPPKLKPTESTGGMVQVAGTNSYRYFESRIYAGDPILVLGEFVSHRFASREDADDDDDQDAETPSAPSSDPAIAALERDDAMMDAARKVTPQVVSRGSGRKPFIITTTPQAQHIALSTQGSRAALGIAALPLAIAALLVWLRYW